MWEDPEHIVGGSWSFRAK